VEPVIGRVRRAVVGATLVVPATVVRLRVAAVVAVVALALAGCATFPDDSRREWREKVESAGELGGPPVVPEQDEPTPDPGSRPDGGQQAPPEPTGCVDPDPQVVATCLAPVAAVAVLPDGRSSLVAERSGRVLRVQRDVDPVLVATVSVDTAAGGGLTGIVLSPGYAEDRLVYAYATTPTDNRVLRIAPGEEPEPVLTGIPKGARDNGGALATDGRNLLLVATGSAGLPPDPASLAGKLLRIDTLGRPAPDNPDPASPIYSSGLEAPGGVCVGGGTTWVTDRTRARDVVHRAAPGALGTPVWSWTDRPGVGGCVAQGGLLVVAQTTARAVFVLRPSPDGRTFTGAPETLLKDRYGRLTAAAPGPDGLLWVGTANKGAQGKVVPSDDRVIRIQPPTGGGESRT
jgi:glucose/arabinose dehydrogenase